MEQIQQNVLKSLDELSNALRDARAHLDTLLWLRERLNHELKELSDKTGDIHLFTESEAAQRLRITTRQLADLRRSEQLPHIRLGRDIRYSSKNLAQIVELLDTSTLKRQLRRVS